MNMIKFKSLKFWILRLLNKISSFRWKCLFGHVWKIENLTDTRGRSQRMQRRCVRCRQRHILTINASKNGSQRLFWFNG